MKNVAVLLLGASLLGGATSPLPVFEYKGFRAGDSVDLEHLETCKSEEPDKADQMSNLFKDWQNSQTALPSNPDLVTCSDKEAKLAGMPVTGEYVTFYKSRLSSITVTFNAAAYSGVTNALRAKYGAPCKTSTEELQNTFGAKVTSIKYTWCFSTGKLTADMYFPNLKTSTVEYTDHNKPPAEKPKVDF